MDRSTKTTALLVAGLTFVWPFFRANYYEVFLLTRSQVWTEAIVLYVIFSAVCILVCVVSAVVSSSASGATNVLAEATEKTGVSAPVVLGFSGSIGCALVLMAGDYGVLPGIALTAGIVLWALSFVSILALWSSLLRRYGKRRILIVMTLSFTLSFGYGLLAACFGSEVEAVLLSLCCALSTGLWCLCPKPTTVEEEPPVFNLDAKKTRSNLAFLITFLIVSSIANGYLFTDETIGFPFEDRIGYNLAMMTLGFVLSLAAIRMKSIAAGLKVFWIAIICFFAICLVFMLALPDPFDKAAHAGIIGIKSSLHFVLWVAVLFLMKRGDFNPVKLFGVFVGAQLAAGLLGYCAIPALLLTGLAEVRLIVAISSVLLIGPTVHLVLQTESKPEQILAANAAVGSFNVYQEIAEKFSLTNTETEVLESLVSGSRRKRIASQRSVSKNTIDSHVRNIYAKTGCHKKDDIIRLVEDFQS